MNILILQGSPRATGNTAWMAEEWGDEQKTEEARKKVIELAAKV